MKVINKILIILDQISDLTNKLEHKELEYAQLEKNYSSLDSKYSSKVKEFKDLKERTDFLEDQYSKFTETLDNLKHENLKLQDQLDQKSSENQNLVTILKIIHRLIDSSILCRAHWKKTRNLKRKIKLKVMRLRA